jgi:signal transduction histidine kinase
MQASVIAHAEGGTSPATAPKPRTTVTALLIWLVLACLLPEVLGASAVFYFEYRDEQARLEATIVHSVRDKVQSVDTELTQFELIAQALATSGSLKRQDFSGFHQRAKMLMSQADVELTVVLFDKEGQQLVNTNVPWGVPLPKRFNVQAVRSVFASGRAESPTLIFRASDGRPVISSLTPVFAGQDVSYVMGVAFTPEKFNRIMSQSLLLTDATTTIIDRTGTIAARSHDPTLFIGKKIDPETWAQLENQSEGVFDVHLTNGNAVQTHFKSSAKTGWSVLLTKPRLSLNAQQLHRLTLMANGSVLVLVLSLGLAWFVGRRITLSVQALKLSAIAFGQEESITQSEASLRETHEVAQALALSADQLKKRTNELKNSNQSLKERTTELAEAQKLAQIGNWTWDFQSHHFVASDELLRQFGPQVMLAYQDQDGTVFPPEALRQLEEASNETARTGVGYSLDLNVFNKEGELIWVNARGVTTLNESGKVTGLHGTVQEITQYKSKEAELLESKIRLETALTSSDLVLWEFFVQRNELVFVERLAIIQGYDWGKDPIPVNSYMARVFPADVALMYRDLEKYLRGDSPKFETSFRALHTDGHYLWLHSIGRIVERDAAGNPLRLLGVTTDITERKLNESKMETLHDEMDAMLVWQVAQHTVAALAHEINQPLASLSILSEVAKRALVSDRESVEDQGEMIARCEETLTRMNIEIERAASVVRSLLISVNKPDITRAPALANELIGESIQTALDEGVFSFHIKTDYAANLPPVKVNRLQVNKVLLNLIHNSAQAMQGAQMLTGTIEISTALAADGHEICITVQDEGPGISELMQQEIFQPYISTKSNGMGLGLTISRALIEAHGGKLWATQVPGHGATFHFTLPTIS